MKERPILFSGPMIRAILAGTKTQTRRIIKLTDSGRVKAVGSVKNWHIDDPDAVIACPYGIPGDRLWVRECIYIDTIPTGPLPKTRPAGLSDDDIYYRADGECCDQIPECCCAEIGKPKWRPSIHMPRWASPITLEITEVRVQRLQEISEEDAKAEGLDFMEPNRFALPGGKDWMPHDAAFQSLWDFVNGPGAWARNDWVWALTLSDGARGVA